MATRPNERALTAILIMLTFTSGATNVASFTGLGSVFTSVMTGNIVVGGLAVARGSVTLFGHAAVAIAGYIAGVAVGTWIIQGFRTARQDTAGDGGAADGRRALPSRTLPSRARWALAVEFTLLVGLTLGWELTGARPAGGAQLGLLAATAAAMGVQSSAVRDMGLAEMSTTFLTGTLTGLVGSLAHPSQTTKDNRRRFYVLAGLAAGAALCGLLVADARAGVPVLPLASSGAALVLATAPLRRPSLRRPSLRRPSLRRPSLRRPSLRRGR